MNVVRKAQAAAWEEKFMAMKAKQKESNKVCLVSCRFVVVRMPFRCICTAGPSCVG